MITDNDKKIVREWFEPYKYANISTIQKIYYKDRQYGYNIVRKRLLEMIKADYIKVHRDKITNKNIYTYNEKDAKLPSQHRLLILDVLTEMKYLGFDVELFEVEKHWSDDNDKNGKKFYSDGFTIFTMNDGKENRRYHYFIEVQTSNNITNLEKYDLLYDTGIVQKFYNKDFFPKRVLLISDREYKKPIELKHCQVIQLNSKLENFYKVLI